MELSRYLYPIRKWWWLLVISAVLAAASSYYMVSQQEPVYQATATLLIGRAFEDPNPSGSELVLSEQLARTYADISLRRPVRQQTMQALGLNYLPPYVVQPLPNSQLLEIRVTHNDPLLAQTVANELANQLIRQSPTSQGPDEMTRQAFVSSQLDSLQANIEETQQEILAKQADLEEAFSAREIADLQGDIAGLQSKLSTLQDNYGQLLSGTQREATNTLTLIEPAPLPRQPVGPKQLQTVLTTVVVALALAIGTAYLLAYLDDTVKTPDDISRISNLPSLPGIPLIRDQEGSYRIISLEEPLDPAVDAFRALRTVVEFKVKRRSNPLILVTSASPAEGKTMVSANLAVAFAQAGNKVLLVDADIRRPSQHHLFGLPNHNGIVGFLLSQSLNEDPQHLTERMEQYIQKSPQDQLWVLQSGTSNGLDAQVLDLTVLEEVLILVSTQFDYVIVDSAPLLATSDSFSISAAVDGVILLAMSGKTRRKDLKDVISQLEMVEANVLGVAMNKLKGDSTAYYYRYYNYYRSESDNKKPKHDIDEVEKEVQPSPSNGSLSKQAGELRQAQSELNT